MNFFLFKLVSTNLSGIITISEFSFQEPQDKIAEAGHSPSLPFIAVIMYSQDR